MSILKLHFVPWIVMATLGLAPLHGAPAPPPPPTTPVKEEEQLFQSAKQVWSEGLFDLSQQRLEALFKKFPSTSLRADGCLLQVQNLYYLGRMDEAIAIFKNNSASIPDKLRADFLFWWAETLSAKQQWSDAESKYREYLGLKLDEAQTQKGQLELAWMLLKQNRDAEAMPLLQKLGAKNPNTLLAQRAALILAKAALAKGQTKEATQQLEALLARKPQPEIVFETSYWLGEIHLEKHQWRDAAVDYERITGNPKAFPKGVVAKAWLSLGQARQESGEPDKAKAAFEKAFALADNEETKLLAFKRFLESGRTQKRLPETIAELRDYPTKNADRPNAASASYAIALAFANDGKENEAIATLESLLRDYPQNYWCAPALLQLGKLYSVQGKKDLALQTLQKCLAMAPTAATMPLAEFERGQIFYRQGDYAQAAQCFTRASESEPKTAERALFNLLLTQEQLGKLDDFVKTRDRLMRDFPNSPFRERLVIEHARLLEKQGRTEEARSIFQGALTQASPEQRPMLLLRLADLLYQSQNFQEASAFYDQFQKEYANDPLFAEVAYKGICAGIATKKLSIDQACKEMSALQSRFPRHPMAANMAFSAGELSFQKQDYANAQTFFEKITHDYNQNELVPEAYFWAGKSAMSRGDLAGAIGLLEKVPDASPLKSAARLLQGRIYHQQMKFENALTLLDAVLAAEKQGPLHVEALLRKGDCYFAMGGNDATTYEEAIKAYAALLNGKQGNIAQRHEAGFKRAKALQKLNRFEEALAGFLDVVMGRMASGEPEPSNEPAEYFWRIKAGLEAAEMKEARKDWRGAIAVYRSLEKLGGPNHQEFQDAINRIKRDNFLFDEDA